MKYSTMQNKVFNIFKDAFGEDNVFRYNPESNPELIYLDYDGSSFMYMSVQYPDFYIRNLDKGEDSKHLIRGLIGIYIINTEGELEEELWTRTAFTRREWKEKYVHSHLQKFIVYRLCTYEEDEEGNLSDESTDYDDECDFAVFHTKFSKERMLILNKFCYGRDESFFEDVRFNIRELKSKKNLLMNWEFYVDNILEVLSQESETGGPYVYYTLLYLSSTVLFENIHQNIISRPTLRKLFKQEVVRTSEGTTFTIENLLNYIVWELTKEEKVILHRENTTSIIYPIIMDAFRRALKRKLSRVPDNLSELFVDPTNNNSPDISLLDLVLVTERGIALRDKSEYLNSEEIKDFSAILIPTMTKQGYPTVKIINEEAESDNYKYELSVNLCKLIVDYFKRKSYISNTIPNEYF